VVNSHKYHEELAAYQELVAEPVFYPPFPVSMFTGAYRSNMEDLRPVFPLFHA
jgi:hypothetical protein